MTSVAFNAVLVGAGGFAGAALRYLSGVALEGVGGWFPASTFIVNMVGAAVLGAVLAMHAGGVVGENARLLFATGLCGGFTTFSAFSAEVVLLLREGRVLHAAGYASLSVVVCVACLWAGWTVCSRAVAVFK